LFAVAEIEAGDRTREAHMHRDVRGVMHRSVAGWPQPRSYPMRECLLCILNEDWERRLYAERDLNALEARS
jgi:hypothetical protein